VLSGERAPSLEYWPELRVFHPDVVIIDRTEVRRWGGGGMLKNCQ